MTAWTLLPDSVTRRVRVTLSSAPEIECPTFRIAPVEACWYVVQWGDAHRIGGVLVEGNLVGGAGSRAGGRAVLGFTADTQPPWLADIMAEAVHV